MNVQLLPTMIITTWLMGVFNPAWADTCDVPDPNSEYRLVFEDNFDGNVLDRNKWNTEFLWGPGVIINNELQYYVNEGQFGYNPFVLADGVLAIEAIKTPFDRSQLYLTRSIYSATSAELLWRVPEGAVSYDVLRNGEYQATVAGGSYFEPQIREGIDYAYEVVAKDANGNNLVSAQLTINTADRSVSVPRQPFSLELSANVYSENALELVWRPPNRGHRFEIYRDDNLHRELQGSDYSSLYEAGVVPGRTYEYRVLAYDVCDELIIEDSIAVNTADGLTTTSLSERLVIQANIYSKTSGEIAWNSVQGATNYDIYDNDTFVANITGRSLFVDDFIPGIDRKFRVLAFDADGVLVDQTTRVINTADNSFARNRQPFLSGIITSYDAFKFRYGYVEMRARMPAGKGLWSAFWLLNAYYHDAQPEDPEIDIIEAIGDLPTTGNYAYHVQKDLDGDSVSDYQESKELSSVIEDFSADFHTYAVDWSPGVVVWYVDDVEVARVESDDVSSEQMYVLLNLAVGGTFPGDPDESTPFPARMEIDYVRVYQR
ncbi:MAG: family 16 glycosylhydrolase [Gammaproteobacteria bacterium]|nr:family 16 glycosylhydrolase [Gammaproteobacteria bacterium]